MFLPFFTRLYISFRFGRAAVEAYDAIVESFQRQLAAKLRELNVPERNVFRVLPGIARRAHSQAELMQYLQSFQAELITFLGRLKTEAAYSAWGEIDDYGGKSIGQLVDLRIFAKKEYRIRFEYPTETTHEVTGTLVYSDPASSMYDGYRYPEGSVGNSPSYTHTEVVGERRFYLEKVS